MTEATLKTLLDRLQAPVLPPRLRAANHRYRCKVDGGEPLDLLLDRGRLSLGTVQDPPDCEVQCKSDEFEAILSGRHNLLTSFMRGETKLHGTLAAAKNLYTFLRYAQLQEATA